MKVFECRLQAQAKKQVISALQVHDLVFLLGNPLCGKSTLLSLLFSRIDRARELWPILIRSCHAHMSGSLRQSLVQALGLPDSVLDEFNSSLVNLLREISRSGLSVVLVVDDIDSFVKGVESKYLELNNLITLLRKEVVGLKIIATSASIDRVEALVKSLQLGSHAMVRLECWPTITELFPFLAYVARSYGIEGYQLVNEDFLKAFYLSTRGATGSVIQTVKVMAMSGVLADGKVATSENIKRLWMYQN